MYLSQNDHSKLYEEYIYTTVFNALRLLFTNNAEQGIQGININGWVHTINKENGSEQTVCILSIYITTIDFAKLDLANIDPKTCFKSLKGISCSTLSSITPIKPNLQIQREDKRFVSSYDVADTLDSSTNLASMDWEDFEHLIRELFSKEFSKDGGEVKITQASRDGGVDAVAFDPDPIRGGKIIIQAKRYTNVVGVSAVRDLYGTIMNEGANKGILVTTSDYGSDSYDQSGKYP